MMHAHTPNARGDWHALVNHLLSVARLSSRNALPFGSADVAYLAGLWHDLGKVSPGFQSYLLACANGRQAQSVPHAAPGAAYAYKSLRRFGDDLWPEVVLPILGHHAGLHEVGNAAAQLSTRHDQALLAAMVSLANELPPGSRPAAPLEGTRRELRLRMIFSALVDADYIDTERHFDPAKARARGEWTRLSELWRILRPDQLRVMWNGRACGAVNRVRRQVYRACVRSATLSPGVFRLTVPTGGGKTRSGLAFALRHAVAHAAHNFRRIIVALPYTSIIDQTAGEYRDIFGDRLVLEHHSQVDADGDEQDEQQLRHRLASENWDHPLIVTTTVQLLESLFHNKPSRCRKLHRVARSIIILDEVQTLPPELLEPTLDVLRELKENYGVTLVFSTATQPAFDKTPYLKHFRADDIREIVREPERFFLQDNIRRVEYQAIRWEQDLDDLADEVSSPNTQQVMIVFNTRRAALDMFDRLRARNAQGLYHLSTLLCGAHRKRILDEIERRLDRADPKPVRLVSTQVVEAGVDLDFPMVYRAMGPLDRIVQAAGRCNREGLRPNKGRVIVFDFEDNRSPPGAYRIGADDARILLQRNEPERLHEPALHTEYFQCLFRDVDLDSKGVQPYRRDLNYPEVARRYKLIEDTLTVVVETYDNGEGGRRLDA